MSYCPWESVSLSPLPEAPPAVRTFCRRLLSLEYPSSTYDFVYEHRFVMLHLSGSRDDEDPHAKYGKDTLSSLSDFDTSSTARQRPRFESDLRVLLSESLSVDKA